MAVGKTLEALLQSFRAEIGASLNPAHNNQVRDTQVRLLQRTQEWLWEDYTWPHLRIERQYPVQAGQRYYDFGADFDITRIERIEVKTDGEWWCVKPGIGAAHYAAHDSDRDERAWPIQYWRLWENEQIEVWPISDINQDPMTGDATLKVIGIRKLRPLVADSDRADLDDRLIVLYSAAEYLASSNAELAQVKMNLANKRYATLRAHLQPKRVYKMFGIGSAPVRRRPVISHYRPPGA